MASSPPAAGEAVFTIGYPHPTLLGAEAKVTEGIVSATSGLGGDARMLQISVPVQGGNSGGPLFDMQGQVVGVVVSKLNAAAVFKWTGALHENVSYAIKVQCLQALLASAPAPPGSGLLQAAPASPGNLVSLVSRLRSTVLLVIAR